MASLRTESLSDLMDPLSVCIYPSFAKRNSETWSRLQTVKLCSRNQVAETYLRPWSFRRGPTNRRLVTSPLELERLNGFSFVAGGNAA